MRSSDPRATFCRRLLEARVTAGLSQKQLGIKAGLDPFVASTRVNRYEVGVHEPDLNMAGRLAKAAGVPLAYLYAEDDQLAAMILLYTKQSKREQRALFQELEQSR